MAFIGEFNYTMLGFTNAKGEAVCCALISKGTYVMPLQAAGIDVQVESRKLNDIDNKEIYYEKLFREFFGEGKIFPGAPT